MLWLETKKKAMLKDQGLSRGLAHINMNEGQYSSVLVIGHPRLPLSTLVCMIYFGSLREVGSARGLGNSWLLSNSGVESCRSMYVKASLSHRGPRT